MQLTATGLLTDWGELLPSPAVSEAEFRALERALWIPPLFGPNLLERVMDRIIWNPESGCWWWQGRLDEYGYGRVYDEVTRDSSRLVHRYVYERLRGPLTPELTLDHRCRVYICCWPGHLVPKSSADNARAASRDRYHIYQPQLLPGL